MQTGQIRVLIVEDHELVRRSLASAARTWGGEVLEAGSVRDGLDQLELRPDLVMVDVMLPDGSGRTVVEKAVTMRPAPAVIAMSGEASAEEAFELARLGARRYLPKPISLEDLAAAFEATLADHPDLAPVVAAHVGHTPMRQVLEKVRGVMVDEALARENGSRSGAARRLGVSRQAVQQAVRLIELAQARGERRGRE
ncbi:MAG: response regulator [Deltaproteobacteria bacterium]|nr:response regulator [Deltaproteobacteria bacterium]